MADEGQEKEKLQRKKGANLMKNLFKKIGALLVAAIMVKRKKRKRVMLS